MRFSRSSIPWSLGVVLALGVFAAAAQGQERALTEADVVGRALKQNPTLAAALLDAQSALEGVRAEEDLRPYLFGADANVSRTTSPALAPGGGVTLSTGQSFALTTGLGKTFATGTQLSLDLTGTIDRRESAATTTLGPGYGLLGRFTVTQPLLRGFGLDVGEASLRQARLARSASEVRADRVASETLRDVLTAWWELWVATTAVTIQQEARDLAARQLAEAQTRIERGTLAAVEALTFQTALAARDEDVAQARDVRKRQALELLRLLGSPETPADGLVASADAPGTDPNAVSGDATEIVASAREASFQLHELELQVEVAREQQLIAGESLRPRLDLQAWAQGEGLGDRSWSPAFEQIGRAQAGGAFLGVSFEMPVSDGRRRAQRAQAALAVQIAEQQLRATQQQIETEAAAWLSRREAAEQRTSLAARTEELARQQVEAERRRFNAGAAIALQVQQAEDAWRQARLRGLRARVDRVEADLGLDHLTGRLLARWATASADATTTAR